VWTPAQFHISTLCDHFVPKWLWETHGAHLREPHGILFEAAFTLVGDYGSHFGTLGGDIGRPVRKMGALKACLKVPKSSADIDADIWVSKSQPKSKPKSLKKHIKRQLIPSLFLIAFIAFIALIVIPARSVDH